MASPLHIHITPHDKYLECHIQGEDSAENSLAYWMKVLEASRKHKIDRILIIEELLGKLKTSESYALVDQHVDAFWGKRIAFIDLIPGDEKANALGITMAQNRGVAIEVFTDKTTAIQWLLQ